MNQYAEQALIDRLTRPLLLFSRHKLAGAGVLLCAALIAIVWANSPWSEAYFSLLNMTFAFSAGEFELSKPLQLWINDGMMGVFFFVVGLEVKREFLAGELATPRKAMLPISAAVGGMVVPALVYLAINLNQPGEHGWGIPMATDIAFALGVLALLPVPVSLKIFLTALAIVDDIGSIIVIAVFYTDHIALASLLFGTMFLSVSIVANRIGVRNPIVYFLLGTVVWLLFLKSGVHATLAAVLMAFTIPARSVINSSLLHGRVDELLTAFEQTDIPDEKALMTSEQHHLLHAIERVVEDATAPLQELEHALMPLVTFLVLPVFALANAGVKLDVSIVEALSHPVALGVIAGLFLGKPVGILLFSWVAVKTGLATLPAGVGWRDIAGVGVLAGIGFTMSLFITSLAFDNPEFVEVAKVGILAGSLISGLLGWRLLRGAGASPS